MRPGSRGRLLALSQNGSLGEMNKKTALTVSSPRSAVPKLPVGWAGFQEASVVGGGALCKFRAGWVGEAPPATLAAGPAGVWGGGPRVGSPLPRAVSHTRGKPRGVSHGAAEEERGRLRPGDPRDGLSHTSPGLADPSPLFQRSGELEAHGPGPRGLRSWRQEGAGSKGRAAREALVAMATGGLVSVPQGVPPPHSGDCPPRVGEAPARARSRGREFQVGQEGVNGGPLPGFHPLPPSLGRGGERGGHAQCAPPAPLARVPTRTRPATPARARAHARTHARNQPISSPAPARRPALTRTTASGSTHAATPVVSHVTHDARAPAARGGAVPGGERAERPGRAGNSEDRLC